MSYFNNFFINENKHQLPLETSYLPPHKSLFLPIAIIIRTLKYIVLCSINYHFPTTTQLNNDLYVSHR